MQTSAPASKQRVAVVGGGITGLTAAYRLLAQGCAVQLFEGAERLGGSIQSERSPEGWLIEAGPNTILDGEPEVKALIAELGLESELLPANAITKNRFILRDGVFQPVPMGLVPLLRSRLYSTSILFKVLGELFYKRRERPADVSLAQFVEDHFGREVVDYALNPIVSGIYAGDPARLSTQHAFPKLWDYERSKGSLIRGMMAAGKARRAKGQARGKIVTFKEGLSTLVKALAARLPAETIHLQTPVRALRRNPAGGWTLRLSPATGEMEQDFDQVILALPAQALAALQVGEGGERSLASLAEVEQPSVSSLFLGYRRDQVSHPLNGFGGLIPALEKRPLLGVLFSSSLFERRAPEGHVALTVMIGGTRNSALARKPLAELLELVKPELETLLGVKGEPVFLRHRAWSAAIPQYNLGYESVLATLAAFETAHPGVYVGGNVRDGIAVPSCIQGGMRLAHGVCTP